MAGYWRRTTWSWLWQGPFSRWWILWYFWENPNMYNNKDWICILICTSGAVHKWCDHFCGMTTFPLPPLHHVICLSFEICTGALKLISIILVWNCHNLPPPQHHVYFLIETGPSLGCSFQILQEWQMLPPVTSHQSIFCCVQVKRNKLDVAKKWNGNTVFVFALVLVNC